MYEIIEKNQYGVLVKNTTGTEACIHCKYERGKCGEAHNYCKLNPLYYFLPDSEFTDAYNSETQKELIDLRVELRVEKEKSKALEEYSRGLELKVKELEICEHPYKSLERNENGLFCNKCKKQISHDPNIY